MDYQLKKAVTMVNNAKIEVLKFVKDFLENGKPIIFDSDPLSERVQYSIETELYGEILLNFFKYTGMDYYTYSVKCVNLNLDLVPQREEHKAKCEVLLFSNHKLVGLEKEYERWEKIEIA